MPLGIDQSPGRYKLSGTETGAFGPEDGFERYMVLESPKTLA